MDHFLFHQKLALSGQESLLLRQSTITEKNRKSNVRKTVPPPWSMASPETLNEIQKLNLSRFGRPSPRHGLKLLYWFANNCISFDENNKMVTECEPEDEKYGFHYFENRNERNGMKLLPEVNFPYYVVGNLNSEGAEDLPPYISREHTFLHDNSNTDRIIVSLDDRWFDKVYITTHINGTSYDPDNTYNISRGLLIHIRRMTLDEFLIKTGYYNKSQDTISPLHLHYPNPPRGIISDASSSVPIIPPRKQECQIKIEDSSSQSNNTQGQSRGFWNMIKECTIL